MKQVACILSVTFLVGLSAQAQVTITADDMFNKAGESYTAYSNDFDPTSLTPTPFAVASSVAGSAGASQFWDFTKGPTNVQYQFDYVALADVDPTVSADFASAKIVERQTDQATGKMQYIFFEQVAGLGRRVYGFYAENSFFDPSNVFVPPIVDFPDQIKFGDEWTTSTTWSNTIGGLDPTDPEGGGFSISAQTSQTSTLKADAWGTVVLPDPLGGFGQALRINEAVTIDISVDDGSGGLQHVETDYARNYYWLMPGRGMVAALASTQTTTPTADNFSTATQFWRMFQTNKKQTTTGGGCVDPKPVSDLKIRYNGGQVLLSWNKVDCATQYRLEYSTNSLNQTSWMPMGGNLTNQFFVLDSTSLDRQRFYRVVSLK